jgi:hypothetical protein
MDTDDQQLSDEPITPEIVDENTVKNIPETAPTTVVHDLENLIKTNINGIDKGRNEISKMKEMLNDTLLNDPTYQKHDEEAKAATKKKSATKSEIMKATQNHELLRKIHALSTEVKEMNEALSDYLREYERLSGSNEIETDDGVVREIIYSAKLVKKSPRAK